MSVLVTDLAKHLCIAKCLNIGAGALKGKEWRALFQSFRHIRDDI